MIGHQALRPQLDARCTSLLGQQIAIDLAVPVLEKYLLPPVPARREIGLHAVEELIDMLRAEHIEESLLVSGIPTIW